MITKTLIEIEADALQTLHALGMTTTPTMDPNDGYVVASKIGTQFVSASHVAVFARQAARQAAHA